ncbi:MAG: ZIP family metal transporter [Patescibacteria group bacterium]
MVQTWLYTILSVLGVSLIAFAGLFTFSLRIERLKKILLFLISFAAGSLLGDAFIHLLPEAVSLSPKTLVVSLWILGGLVLFFVMEKVLKWRHCHELDCEDHVHTVGMMSLIGDGVHNFIDGAIIAASFLVSPALGLVTTIAVILHEIPQEMGDFGILIHAGYSRMQALFYNFISALTAVAGAALTLTFGAHISSLTSYLVPLTIGGFIYIATADLIPELHKEVRLRYSVFQLLSFLLGIGLMALLLLLE